MASLPDAALLLDQILAGIGQPFYALDRDFRFVLFNDEAARYLQRPAGQVLGRTVWEIFPHDIDHERGHVLRKGMASRAVIKGELQSMMAARLVSYCIFPLGDGIGVVFRDVSDRRDAEIALERRTAELEAVLGTVPVAVWVTHDPQGRTIVRNRSATEILRVPPDERLLSVGPNQMFRFEQDGVVLTLERLVPQDSVFTNGAGNYSGWLHRYLRYRGLQHHGRTQLAPTSGAMGYGVPAAVAASLLQPQRTVVNLAGDGDFLMTGQELATAVAYGARRLVSIVVDNAAYGTIRMHPEREYPGRVSGSDLVNPDFAALARAYGWRASTIERTAEFEPAFADALASGRPTLLHLKLPTDVITSRTTLGAIRSAAQERTGQR